MKFAKTTLILATLLFAMPALAKDKLDKELKKEKNVLQKKSERIKKRKYTIQHTK
jgi:hypothetical protein